MNYQGPIGKMVSLGIHPVRYDLPVGDDFIPISDAIGKYIAFEFTRDIFCIGCGRKTSKSFAQGYCYSCLLSSPATSECILRPELCQAHLGIARDMEWARHHCLTDHVVYLSVTSGLKVGVTRAGQIPTRWIDQGASSAIRLAVTPNRYEAGRIEIALEQAVSDRTIWQRMLKNEYPEDIDLKSEKYQLLSRLSQDLQANTTDNDEIVEITYPVTGYPKHIKGQTFDKQREIFGVLWGIRGQYLMFDDGSVLNIRRHSGYEIRADV